MTPPDPRKHNRFFSWGDRRKWNEHRMKTILVAAVAFYGCAMVFAGSPVKVDTGSESLGEHTVAIMGFQWWALAAAFGIIQLLVGFIYISGQASSRRGQTDLKADMNKGHVELNKRLDDLFDLLGKKQDIHVCDKLREACGNFKPTGTLINKG
jgi:hypothetical protein